MRERSSVSSEEPEDTPQEASERASIMRDLAVFSTHGRVSKKHLLGRGKFSSVYAGCVVMQPSQTSVDLAIKEFSYVRKKPPLPVLRVCQQEAEILRSLSHVSFFSLSPCRMNVAWVYACRNLCIRSLARTQLSP